MWSWENLFPKVLHTESQTQGGTSMLGSRGGLDLTSSLEAKFGTRFSQVHQIRGKIWEVLLPQDAKFGKESQFWGHLGLYLKFKGQNLGYLSPIFLEAKLGLLPEFQRQNLGSSLPDLLIWKYPPGEPNKINWSATENMFSQSIDLYAERWAKREQVNLKYLSEFKDRVKEFVVGRISGLKGKLRSPKCKILNQSDVKDTPEKLHADFLVPPIK